MARFWSRREALQLAGSGIVFLSGCNTVSPQQSAGQTVTPAPPASAKEIEDYDCPPYGDQNNIICSHTVETDSASVYLLPSQTVGKSPESLTLTFYNNSVTELNFNPFSWTIRFKDSSGWTEIEQKSSGSGKVTVAPGDTVAWSFEEAVGYINEAVAIGSGTYTAEINVPDPSTDDWITCLALFSIQ